MYTTVTNVRQSGGFVGNANVTDAFISTQITRAESLINSYISDAYALPIPSYYRQTIVFTGTGTGTATMTITIDGVDYEIDITLGMTATQAADAFRTATLGLSGFIADGLGAGTTVTIYSCESGDPGVVTISSTNPQTVAGITATGGTIVAIAPPLLEALATEIAVAFLLITEYGPEAQDTDKDGFKRLALWEETLKRIASKNEKIFSFCGEVLAGSSTKRISFFPTTGSVDVDGQPIVNKITMNKKF